MITADILKKVKESKKLYHVYIQDEYFYMIKFGNYEDEIEKTKRLHNKGVNYNGPISQIQIDQNKYLLEEYLAKGNSFERIPKEFRYMASSSSSEVYQRYCMFFSKYLDEIKKRANADQSQYNKLFDDLSEMYQENLGLDVCSLGNLFYDEVNGFTIIDAYPGNPLPDRDELIRMIIGFIPSIECLDNFQYFDSTVPDIYAEELKKSLEDIIQKIDISFRWKENGKETDYNKFYARDVITVEKIEELSSRKNSNTIRISRT